MKKIVLVITFLICTTFIYSSNHPERILDPEYATPDEVKNVISEYQSLNDPIFSDKNSILQFIAEHTMSPESFLYLLEVGADINIMDDHGVNPYDLYTNNSNKNKKYESLFYEYLNLENPINIFKYTDITSIMQYLNINHKFDINQKLGQFYPIEWIVLFNTEETLANILGKFKIEIENSPDLILSSFRYKNYSIDKISILNDYGFDINGYRKTEMTSYHASYEIYEKKDKVKEYPITFALKYGIDEKIISELINRGAILNVIDGEFNKSTLHLSVSYIKDQQLLTKIIDAYDNVNLKDMYGRTPIYYAMDSQPLENIKFLTKNGCDLNIPCDRDGLPLNRVIYREDDQVILYVLENTENVNSANLSGGKPLYTYLNSHRASSSYTIEILDLFIQKGSVLNELYWGNTELLNYCELGRDINVVKFLILNGSDPNILDDKGIGLLDYMNKNKYLAEYIPQIKVFLNK